MASSNYRASILLRVLALAATLFAFCLLLTVPRHPLTLALAGVLVLAQCWLLIASVDRYNRLMGFFFEAVRNADFTQSYSLPKGASFERLRAEYEAVMNVLRKYKLEREKQFQYIRAITKSIDVGILVFARDGEVDFCNEAFVGMMGTAAPRNIAEIAAVNEDLLRAMREIKNGRKELVRLRLKSEWLQLIVSASDFVLLGEKYRLISVQNIRRELEDNEIDAWQKLTRVLTHEIMNSITPISSLASTTSGILSKLFDGVELRPGEEKTAREDARNALHSIERRSQGLLQFVESYRELLRLPQPRLGKVACADLISRIKALMGGMLGARKIDLQCRVEPEELELTADAGLLEQLLINLVKNSVEAMTQAKKPLIRIAAYLDARGKPVIEVSDNGSGIAEANLDKVFIPFFTTKGEGSGVGLSLCRQIMRLHNGSIDLSSAPGERTVFYLRFN